MSSSALPPIALQSMLRGGGPSSSTSHAARFRSLVMASKLILKYSFPGSQALNLRSRAICLSRYLICDAEIR